MNKRTLALLFAAVSFAGTASAQTYACGASASFPTLRAGGISELVGDVVVSCTGGSFNTLPPQSITITLNAPVTSGLFPAPGNFATFTSEALLLVDEPQPSFRFNGTNVFKGVQTASNTIQFNGVTIVQPGMGGSRIYRFTNVRVNVSQLPVGGNVQLSVSAAGPVPLPVGTQVVGTVGAPTPFDVRTCDDSQGGFTNLQQATSQNASLASGSSNFGNFAFNVRFAAAVVGAFRRRIAPTQDPTAIDTQYNSESGFVDTAALGNNAGIATQGTRLMSRFTNLPAGIRLFVTTQPLNSASALTPSFAANLISTDANGAGASTPVLSSGTGNCPITGATAPIAEIPIVNGSALAVWEVTASSLSAPEKVSFGVVVAYNAAPPSSPSIGSASASGTLGPISTTSAASDTAPRPRYDGTAITQPAVWKNGIECP